MKPVSTELGCWQANENIAHTVCRTVTFTFQAAFSFKYIFKIYFILTLQYSIEFLLHLPHSLNSPTILYWKQLIIFLYTQTAKWSKHIGNVQRSSRAVQPTHNTVLYSCHINHPCNVMENLILCLKDKWCIMYSSSTYSTGLVLTWQKQTSFTFNLTGITVIIYHIHFFLYTCIHFHSTNQSPDYNTL